MFELQGVVVLAYPELDGRETIDQRRQLSWILFADSLLNGMNWKWLALGLLIRGLSSGDLDTGDSERGLRHDVKLILWTAGLRIWDVWCWILLTTTDSEGSLMLLAFKEGADLPKCEFFMRTKFDGISRHQKNYCDKNQNFDDKLRKISTNHYLNVWKNSKVSSTYMTISFSESPLCCYLTKQKFVLTLVSSRT